MIRYKEPYAGTLETLFESPIDSQMSDKRRTALS